MRARSGGPFFVPAEPFAHGQALPWAKADHRRIRMARAQAQESKKMASHGLIAWLIIGAVAGWLAGTFVKGGGFGLLGDIVVGVIGAFIGGWLAGVLGIHLGSGWISSILTASAGAIVLLVILRAVRRA